MTLRRFCYAACMVACAVVACGGSGTPPEATSPDEALAHESEPAADFEDASTRPDALPGEEQAQPTEAEPAPAGPDDVRRVLQLVIDDEALVPYLKLGEPGHFPLKIAGDVPPNIELTKATELVKVVDEPDSDKEPVLVFTNVDVSAERASVSFKFAPEGVKGAARLKKRDGRWELVNSRVSQY